MRRVVEFVILVASTFYMALIYKSRGLLFLGYVEMFLILLLLIYNAIGLFSIYITIEAPLGITELGKKVPVKISIHNYSSLPTGKISIQLVESYSLFQKKKKTVFYSSVAGRSPGTECAVAVIDAEWQPTYTGKVVMRVAKAKSFDLLGTLALPLPGKAIAGSEIITVLPSIYHVPVEIGSMVRDFAVEQERYVQSYAEETVSEQFQIRTYQPGDRIRSIHWKLSAKEDELMVKEYRPVSGCPILFFLDFTGKKSFRNRKKESTYREDFFTVVISLSESMIQNECKHYVIWYDSEENDVMRYRVEQEEDIYTLLTKINHIANLPEKMNLEEEYYEKYHEKAYAAKLMLNHTLQLTCNEEQTISYQINNLGESLAAQTIYL